MKILVADPAGNITVFVLDPVGSSAERIALARAILAKKSSGGRSPEQVGFVIPPGASMTGSDPVLWRLEMMGGEFCGNAARSFGLYVARKEGLKGKVNVLVSVSGMDEPVRVDVDITDSRAAAEMPKPIIVEALDYEGRSLPVIVFEGITHVIAPDLEADRDVFFAIKTMIEKKFSSPATGVMFYNTASRFMRPAVYVQSTDTLVFESSCGSGSAALGVWLSREQREGSFSCAATQPGGVIETELTKRAGEISCISIGGKVRLDEPEEFSWPICE